MNLLKRKLFPKGAASATLWLGLIEAPESQDFPAELFGALNQDQRFIQALMVLAEADHCSEMSNQELFSRQQVICRAAGILYSFEICNLMHLLAFYYLAQAYLAEEKDIQ